MWIIFWTIVNFVIWAREWLKCNQRVYFLYLLHLYPGFYSCTEGATWKILNLLSETLLIKPSIKRFPDHSAESTEEGCILHRQMPLAHLSRIGGYGNWTPDLPHGRPEYIPQHHQPIPIVDHKNTFNVDWCRFWSKIRFKFRKCKLLSCNRRYHQYRHTGEIQLL